MFEDWEEGLKEYLPQFIAEAQDIIPKIEQDLISLEQKFDREVLNSLFRSWHTIKGAAGFLGFEKTVELCHKTESLIALIRDKNIKPPESFFDIIFDAHQKLKELIENISLKSKEGETDISEIIGRIEKEKNKLEIGKIEEAEEEKEKEKKEEIEKRERETREETSEETLYEKKEERNEEKERKKKKAYETIRISIEKIEDILGLAEELVLVRNLLINTFSQVEAKYPKDNDVLRLGEVVSSIDKVTSIMRFAVNKIRMVPIRSLFSKLPTIVRTISKQLGKKAELIIEGEDTEIDRSIVDEIEEPLIHLIRNSIDHGIEKPDERTMLGKPEGGKIFLRAYYEGDTVVIECEDDGKGIDAESIKMKAISKGLITKEQAEKMTKMEIINLIFIPGFSTKENATEISGRGVGMDVVREKIIELKGTLEIQTEVGLGTKITMKLPLTIGIMNTLKVISNGTEFLIPLSSVLEILRISPKEIKSAQGQPVVFWRDAMIPVFFISSLYGLGEQNKNSFLHLIVVGIAEKRFGLIADAVISSEEIAVKSLGDIKPLGISGATISASGDPVLVIDLPSLLQKL